MIVRSPENQHQRIIESLHPPAGVQPASVRVGTIFVPAGGLDPDDPGHRVTRGALPAYFEDGGAGGD